jgi:uncharacterized protein YggE
MRYRRRMSTMRRSLPLIAGLLVALIAVSALAMACDSDEDGTAGNVQGLVGSKEFLAAAAALNDSQQTGIWVAGTGEVTADPDVAILVLGVESLEPTVTEAQSAAIAAMNEVMAVLAAEGVAEKDIQTQRYSIDVVERWDEDSKEPVTIGYQVTNTVRVKIREIEKAGLIIDAVAEAGGDLTRVERLGFTVDDPTSLYEQAREEAVLDAMAKAEQIASVANVQLGSPVYISESGGYVPSPYLDVVRSYSGSLEAGTPISPGELEISISVQMAYAIQ